SRSAEATVLELPDPRPGDIDFACPQRRPGRQRPGEGPEEARDAGRPLRIGLRFPQTTAGKMTEGPSPQLVRLALGVRDPGPPSRRLGDVGRPVAAAK